MIGYVTLGTNDLQRGAGFYDALLADMGAKRLMDMEDRVILWGRSWEEPCLAIIRPADGNEAKAGNGCMTALACENQAKVDAIHEKALALGGTDEGAPGPRGDGSMYFAYFRDLDGNKLAAFCPNQ